MLRYNNKIVLFSLSLLSVISLTVQAEPTNEQHIIVAPKCLLKNLAPNTNYKTLSSSASLSLIETNETGIHQFIDAKHKRTATPCGGFIDVSDEYKKTRSTFKSTKSFLQKYENTTTSSIKNKNYRIQYPEQVNELLKQLNPQFIWTDLAAFSNTSADQFPDRYANSNNGVKAAKWLQDKVGEMVKENNRNDISIFTVATGTSYKQPSVVVKIGDSNEPGIVIGAHMDTLNSRWELKPGADDDGSGSMTTMAIARTIISSDMRFKRPIYFMWYAAEEMGLVGSGYVVKEFQRKNIAVDAVLHFDMTGYSNRNDPTMWLITDNVDPDLTNYIETLITTYVKQPVGRSRCGYACSDHASWNKAGIPASFPFEASFNNDNPYIHTAQDKMNILSLSHMTNYTKLGIAFAVELAEPVV
jgi:leucyl aminopeptidase